VAPVSAESVEDSGNHRSSERCGNPGVGLCEPQTGLC
jgi:hypothetical protein